MTERTAPPAAEGHTTLPYIPGLADVPAARSSICFIDGDQGILEYRGLSIESLAEHSTFEETSYLLLWGKLPNKTELEKWSKDLSMNRDVRFRLIDLLKTLPDTGHPMEALQAAIAALGMFYPDRDPMNPTDRYNSAVRIIAKAPTLVAAYHRLSLGKEYVPPRDDLTHAENFLYMVSGEAPEADVARVMDISFILHAEHSMNASTFAGRVTASTLADPYTVVSSAIGALTGPLHGGANEQVLRMLKEIGSVSRVPEYVKRVRAGEMRLMGFGHRIYKNFDPRAQIIKKVADDVLAVTGRSPMLDIALELERVALADDYFIKHRLYPNVDFYSGIIYSAIGFPVEMFPVLFAVGRTPGWLAQWQEGLLDPEQKIARPRQVYTGPAERHLPALHAAAVSR